MALTDKQKKTAYDISLVVLCLALLTLVITREAFSPAVHTGLLILSVIAIAIVNTLNEAHKEAQLDEMQLAAASFGARWAVTIPCTLMLLILFFPPLKNATLSITETLAASHNPTVPPLLGIFIMGMVLAVILQLAGKSVIAAIWTRTKR